MIEVTKFLIGCAIVGVFAMIEPTINFVGSFSEPCKASFYNSNTLFEATRGCVLRGK